MQARRNSNPLSGFLLDQDESIAGVSLGGYDCFRKTRPYLLDIWLLFETPVHEAFHSLLPVFRLNTKWDILFATFLVGLEAFGQRHTSMQLLPVFLVRS